MGLMFGHCLTSYHLYFTWNIISSTQLQPSTCTVLPRCLGIFMVDSLMYVLHLDSANFSSGCMSAGPNTCYSPPFTNSSMQPRLTSSELQQSLKEQRVVSYKWVGLMLRQPALKKFCFLSTRLGLRMVTAE